MKLLRWTTVIAASAFVVAACNTEPTGPSIDAALDAADPVVVTFAATQGLPGGPFGQHGAPPFMGGMPFAGAPASAALPDSIKLSDAQKSQIQALVQAFHDANAADLAAMKAAHQAARAARQAGKSREEIRAILATARDAAERVHTNANAMREAIRSVLTPLQRTWLDQHRPDRPPRTP